MRCNAYECISNLKWRQVETEIKERILSKQKKRPIKRTEYEGYPCGDIICVERCVVFADGRSKPSCSEHGKTYTLDKTNVQFDTLCLQIDGGVINSRDVRKCDYAFLLQDSEDDTHRGRAVFVELKGSNVREALRQIRETINSENMKAIRDQYQHIYGRIVLSSCAPRIYSTSDFVELKELLLSLGGNLKCAEHQLEEKYICLDE